MARSNRARAITIKNLVTFRLLYDLSNRGDEMQIGHVSRYRSSNSFLITISRRPPLSFCVAII